MIDEPLANQLLKAMPSFWAMVSADRKPIPRMSLANR
jgi:hypothetical protein